MYIAPMHIIASYRIFIYQLSYIYPGSFVCVCVCHNCGTLSFSLCFSYQTDQGDETEGLDREGLERERLERERGGKTFHSLKVPKCEIFNPFFLHQ
jgi:hypothetical protein